MSKLANFWYTLNQIQRRPSMRSGKGSAYLRWLRWQIGSRLVPGPVLVKFVNETRLCLRPGMHGATMNLYVGLDEFQAMGFVLHFLRPPDLFADVGANVGAFTVLAAGAVGARVIAFEPTPRAFADLMLHVKLNFLEDRVDCRQMALSDRKGEAFFTRDLDTLNHVVLAPAHDPAATIRVPASTMDDEFGSEFPVLLKLDAEGFENQILDGAGNTFRSPKLRAAVLEINENCHRYGLTEEQIFRRVTGFGFTAVRYDPVTRALDRCESWVAANGSEANTIFVRDLDESTQRLRAAPRFQTAAYEL